MKILIIAALACLAWTQVQAQSLSLADVPSQTPDSQASQVMQQSTAGTAGQNRGSPELEPFGSNLFNGGFSAEREDGVNPDYIVSRGDQISLRVWGAVEYNDVPTVDLDGNIFVPGVGPVKVAGVANRNLNEHVTNAVRTVYTDNVNVYTSLNGAQPVAVFVTGFVSNPGRFAGIPSNSVLYYLDRAGGIDRNRGSYRDVRVMRDNRLVAQIDLYRFLTRGEMSRLQFKDGDTIVVGRRGGVVSVTGDINNPAQFEFLQQSVKGRELSESVLMTPGVTHVGVSGIRNGEPFSVYVPLTEFGAMDIQDGYALSFRSDVHEQFIVVDVEGSHLGPSRYAVPKHTRLPEILDYIPVDRELTDTASVSIKRLSIAERQRESLENSLRRLETQYLTASSQTDAEASIRAQEARMIGEFVARARKVEPNGRLVVSRAGSVADVTLQNGDVITLPRKSDSVLLSGEVLVTQAMLYQQGMKARAYIEKTGGFSQQADQKRIVLVHVNGEVTTGENPVVRPGDEIIVLPKVPVKNLQIASVIVDILYKIAVAASVAVQL